MRFTLHHPANSALSATCGWDAHIGFFVEVWRSEDVVDSYDALHHAYNALAGVLTVLVNHDFFSIEKLEAAHLRLRTTLPEDLPDDLRLAGQAITQLREAAS